MHYNIFVKTSATNSLYIGSLPVKPKIDQYNIITDLLSLQSLDTPFYIAHLKYFLEYNITAVFYIDTHNTYNSFGYDELATSILYHDISKARLIDKISSYNRQAITSMLDNYKLGDIAKYKIIHGLKDTQSESINLMVDSVNANVEISHMIGIFSSKSLLKSVMTSLDRDRFPTNIYNRGATHTIYSITFSDKFYEELDKYKKLITTDTSYDYIFKSLATETESNEQIIYNLFYFGENVFTNSGKSAMIDLYNAQQLIDHGYAVAVNTLLDIASIDRKTDVTFSIKSTSKLVDTVIHNMK